MSKNVKSDALRQAENVTRDSAVIAPDEIVLINPSPQQEAVIAALLEGKSQREAAAAVGLAEETISRWKRNDPVFLAVLNQRRKEAWELHLDEARKLKRRAVEVLGELLESGDDATRLKAAAVAVRLDLAAPGGPMEPEAAIVYQAQRMTPEFAVEQAKLERLKQEAAQKAEWLYAVLQNTAG